MFVVSVQYRVALHEIDAMLEEHKAWLEKNYADRVFVLSGPQVPRSGGVIVAVNTTRADLEQRLKDDPFSRLHYANYAVTECAPSRVAGGLELLQH
jgi:uncharacterized protein YciI